jgi:hypothetical protein
LRDELLGGKCGVFDLVASAAVQHDLTVAGIELNSQRVGSPDGIVACKLDQSDLIVAKSPE